MIQIKNLISMVIFSRVVETLSFTEAASSLQISKSSVSREISQLEVRTGGLLLNRTTRKVKVTELGLLYYKYCHVILNELNESEKFIKSFNRKIKQELSFFAPVTLGSKYVIPALNALMERNPHMDVSLELSEKKINFAESEYDLAIIVSLDSPVHVFHKLLHSLHFGLYATPEYLATLKKINTPNDLPSYNYLLYCGSERTIYFPFRKHNKKINMEVRSRFRCNNTLALISLALSNKGIAYLPNYAVEKYLSSGQLVHILPEWEMDSYKIWILYKSDKMISLSINHFVNELQQIIVAGKLE